ncbi:uncharacterized protein LOC125037384 [Penaeus chinensis]|uniref:uncharacterized protein LOC125037384 n=1 Tax=Penaeus chinensis TaxID=139456 RepID=UPI001FB5C7BE|nr:uncharacterized protein LOC125037384 [Penaeus chinensis]
MQTAVVLLSCLAYVSAIPVLFLSYAGSSSPLSSFMECPFPVPYVDKATSKITYKCPRGIEIIEAVSTRRGSEAVEIVEIDDLESSALNDGAQVVVVKPLKPTELENPAQGTYTSKDDCKDNEVYNPEIDACLPYIPAGSTDSEKPDKPNKPNRPNKPKKPTKPLEKEEQPVVIAVGKEKRPRCKEGEIYLSELDICVCYPEENCED